MGLLNPRMSFLMVHSCCHFWCILDCQKWCIAIYRLHVFYILFSTSADKYYIGHTTEPIDERLRKHNSNHQGFTGRYRDWTIVLTEAYPAKELAYQRELQVKKWKSRRKIEQLIERM
jgi:putative endonuclease